MAKKPTPDAAPFETTELRKELAAAYKLFPKLKWGVYIFYDYDDEPIYVGQSRAGVAGRIGRHLTNQRTDAVAMSVLDPFEVKKIVVYPLWAFQDITTKSPDYLKAKQTIDALEHEIHRRANEKAGARFTAILNEKDPNPPMVEIEVPDPIEGTIVNSEVMRFRAHKDVRIARRAQIIGRLAQTISERQVKDGLRRTLVVQCERILSLAKGRYAELGGSDIVEKGAEGDEAGKGSTSDTTVADSPPSDAEPAAGERRAG